MHIFMWIVNYSYSVINVEHIFEGTIISRQLGTFGKEEIVYGYIGIRTPEGEQKLIKIDSYTWYESLELGTDVIVEAANLGNTDILVARKVSIHQKLTETTEQLGIAST